VRSRIGIRAVLAVGAATALTIGVMAVIVICAHQAELIAELRRSTTQLAETIRSSTHYDMLENRRESLHRQIVAVSAQPGIEKVRVFNKDGRIMFSSDGTEIGRSVDTRAEACFGCHATGQPLTRLSMAARSRIYRASDGHRVLGTIAPIHNEPGCSASACHAHAPGQRVLGVLDVNVSLATVDREIADSRRRMVLLAGCAIAAGSGMLLWLTRSLVLQPVRALADGTRRVADGDLTTTVPVTRDDELGDLATTFNEMTRRLRDAQTQLVQADRLASVGRLAAGVAHEINNPLTGVLTYASFLLKRAEPGSATRDDLEVIVRETTRCREIVKNLLDYARPTPPHRAPVDLREVVGRSASLVANQFTQRRVRLEVDAPVDLPQVSADPNQIEQVIVNLLVNAADAIGAEGGTVRVRARPGPDGFVELAVEDTGHGISPDDLPHVFEPFFTTKGSHGTGLGLAVTWGIVEGHGGTIGVESEAGAGTRFTVRLPVMTTTDVPVGGRDATAA